MAVKASEVVGRFANMEAIRRVLDEEYHKAGIVGDSSISVEDVQAMVAADLRRAGVRPEDNVLSQAIIAARDGIDM